MADQSGEAPSDPASKPALIVDPDVYDSIEIYTHIETHLDAALKRASELTNTWPHLQARASYLFQINAGMCLIPSPAGIDDHFRQTQRDLRKMASRDAEILALLEVHLGYPVEPEWLGILRQSFLNHPDAAVRELSTKSQIRVKQDASIVITADGRGEGSDIILCPMLKAFLKIMNGGYSSVLVGMENQADQQVAMEIFHDNIGETALMWTCYGWFSKSRFSPGALPALYFISPEACVLARSLAQAQIAFILLHEIGHCAMRHESEGAATDPLGLNGLASVVSGEKRPIDPMLRHDLEADHWAMKALLAADLGTAVTSDIKLTGVGLLLGYLELFEALGPAEIDEEDRIVGTKIPTAGTTRSRLLMASVERLWSSDGHEARWRLGRTMLNACIGELEGADGRLIRQKLNHPNV